MCWCSIWFRCSGALATDNPISRGLDRQFADQEEVGRAFPEDRAEFGKALSPRGNTEDNTISWEKANQFEGKIRIAVMESINKIISEIGDTPKGLARVMVKGKWNFVDESGRPISKQWFDKCEFFREGFATVKLYDKWNFIDENGKLLLDRWHDYCNSFYNGFARVKLNGKWNIIDRNGRYISKVWFYYCRDFGDANFREDFTLVQPEFNGKYYKMDTNGKIYN